MFYYCLNVNDRALLRICGKTHTQSRSHTRTDVHTQAHLPRRNTHILANARNRAQTHVLDTRIDSRALVHIHAHVRTHAHALL